MKPVIAVAVLMLVGCGLVAAATIPDDLPTYWRWHETNAGEYCGYPRLTPTATATPKEQRP